MAVPSPTTDFAAYVLALQSALELTTKHASELPGPSDLSFHRSLDRGFARGLDASSARVLGQANRLLSTVAAAGGSSAKSKQKKRRELQDEDDVVDGFQSAVVDVLDEVLEDADSCLDEFTGQKKAAAIEVKEKVDPVKVSLRLNHSTDASAFCLRLIHRPQDCRSTSFTTLTCGNHNWILHLLSTIRTMRHGPQPCLRNIMP